jgi:hypothetical protein
VQEGKMITAISKTIQFKVYILGYEQVIFSRWFRRVIAKTQFHRSWLAGNMGSFCENGKRRGVLDREFFTNRSLR